MLWFLWLELVNRNPVFDQDLWSLGFLPVLLWYLAFLPFLLSLTFFHFWIFTDLFFVIGDLTCCNISYFDGKFSKYRQKRCKLITILHKTDIIASIELNLKKEIPSFINLTNILISSVLLAQRIHSIINLGFFIAQLPIQCDLSGALLRKTRKHQVTVIFWVFWS